MGLILSGVQPTGNLHLGNYLGAIRNWVNMQGQHECYFMLADLHAITVKQEPAELRENVFKVAALYIACGIDPAKSTIFNQSRIPGHAELAWVLGCNTPIGWLNRMTQFKDKAGKDQEKAGLGLYSYPVLMAADILLYNATHVPVGNDQKQHLELARDIAGKFNREYGVDFFKIPEPLIMQDGARIMSLQDSTKKMSKSEPAENSRVNLTDSNDLIAKKLKSAKTDSIAEVYYDAEARPDVSTLIELLATLRNETKEAAAKSLEGQKSSGLKMALTDALVATIEPIRNKYEQLMADKANLEKILKTGADKANQVAEKNFRAVKDIVGFI